MANKRQQVVHIHSSIFDRQPKPSYLVPGEIAVNNNANNEFISTVNTNNEIARFSSDKVIMKWVEKKEVFPVSGSVSSGETPVINLMFNQTVSSNSPGAETVKANSGFSIDISDLVVDVKTIPTSEDNIAEYRVKQFGKYLGDAIVIPNVKTISVASGHTEEMSSVSMFTQGRDTNVTITVPTSLKHLDEYVPGGGQGDMHTENERIEVDYDIYAVELRASNSISCRRAEVADNLIVSGSTRIKENLTVEGDATINGNLSFMSSSQSSDKNLKDNIKDIDAESVEKVKGVELKTFNYKSDASKRKMYGVIAQDVEEVGLNELVYTNEKGEKSVDYTGLLLLKIAELENRIKELEKK